MTYFYVFKAFFYWSKSKFGVLAEQRLFHFSINSFHAAAELIGSIISVICGSMNEIGSERKVFLFFCLKNCCSSVGWDKTSPGRLHGPLKAQIAPGLCWAEYLHIKHPPPRGGCPPHRRHRQTGRAKKETRCERGK